MEESELALACSRRGLHAQIYCILQIAYFEAKHLFFRFGWKDVKDDCVLSCAVILAVRLFRMSFPLSMNAMPSGKRFARCMATVPGHLLYLHNSKNWPFTLSAVM